VVRCPTTAVKNLHHLQSVQMGPLAHPAYISMDPRGFFSGDKVTWAWNWIHIPSCADVKKNRSDTSTTPSSRSAEKQLLHFFLWRNSPTWARAASFLKFLHHKHDMPQSVGLLRARDRPVAETCTQHITSTKRQDIHVHFIVLFSLCTSSVLFPLSGLSWLCL
jgi:hypothetical protein